MQITDPKIQDYAEKMSTPESDLLRDLREYTAREMEYSEMLCGPLVGNLLAMLVRLGGARRVLEIGTFTGYSALWMAQALPDEGELVTCDYNERYEAIARRYFERSPHGHKIRMLMGPALETIDELKGSYDLVFVDADKLNYSRYYDRLLPVTREGGVMVIDNVFWSGEVLEPGDDESRAIDRMNRTISADERVDQLMLTLRDGLTVLRKRPSGG